MKVFSFNSELFKMTGIQKVLLDIHCAVKDRYDAKIVGTIPFDKVNKNLSISRNDYIRLSNPFAFYNSIVFIHERRYLLLFKLINILLFQRIKLIYVHHSILKGWKGLPIFPKYCVAISESGIENLTQYFNVPRTHIVKIYNCVSDLKPSEHKLPLQNNIRILLPARINSIKRQLEIVEELEGKIDKRIKIYFAGDGPLYNNLKEKIQESNQFFVLGFRSDIPILLQETDYVMLFSQHEGLPISLIEATMCGTPIICNNVGGNAEIAHDGKNAFIANDWDDLVLTLNRLLDVTDEQYKLMSKNSRAIYEQYFTFESFKTKYLNLLDKISK